MAFLISCYIFWNDKNQECFGMKIRQSNMIFGYINSDYKLLWQDKLKSDTLGRQSHNLFYVEVKMSVFSQFKHKY